MALAETELTQPQRPAVQGGVRLRYESTDNSTSLIEQWVRPPLHIAKTYHENSWAINLLTSPTAGLLQDDQLKVECTVGKGAKAALISPAACRVHTMAEGKAIIQQHYRVSDDAVLEVWPAPLVLQSASKLKQITKVEVEASGTLLLTEIISPGRTTYGESFEFDFWHSQLRIYRLGALLTYENFQVHPRNNDVPDWRNWFPTGPYVSIYFLTPQSISNIIEPLNNLSSGEVAVGASPLREGGLGIKVLAQDGLALRKSVLQIRELLIDLSGISFPSALKRAQTFFY